LWFLMAVVSPAISAQVRGRIAMATRTDIPRDLPEEGGAAPGGDHATAAADWTFIEEDDLELAAATPVEPDAEPSAATASSAAAEVAEGSESLRVVIYSDASFSATTSTGGHIAFLANERGTVRVPLVAKAVPQPPPERPQRVAKAKPQAKAVPQPPPEIGAWITPSGECMHSVRNCKGLKSASVTRWAPFHQQQEAVHGVEQAWTKKNDVGGMLCLRERCTGPHDGPCNFGALRKMRWCLHCGGHPVSRALFLGQL
jgi:hypothetical protein